MTVGGSIESVGDNKEFTLLTTDEVTVYLNDSTKTSADDTASSKYFNTWGAVKYFCLRTDQTIHITSMNGITFTDPITVLINKSHTEKFDTPMVIKMCLKSTVAGTNVKIRVRGRGD